MQKTYEAHQQRLYHSKLNMGEGNSKKDVVEEALKDPSKKRRAEDEIEIDLEKPQPLSKKQKRLLRRGKVTLEELQKKYNLDEESVKEYKASKDAAHIGDGDAAGKSAEKTGSTKDEAKNRPSVWIGNLAFDTSREELERFFNGKIPDLKILRIHLPLNDRGKNKGFAHMDLETSEQAQSVVALSESDLNGRRLLIKDARDFGGRPDKDDLVSLSKNPPSRILFVGNLSFDTTDAQLKVHFQHCGDITKVRMATFQDSGKCKGFAFVDFATVEAATEALKDKSCRRLAGRPLRMEFGEDRSKRVVRTKPKTMESGSHNAESMSPRDSKPSSGESSFYREPRPPRDARPRPSRHGNDKRVKSSIALASAQRGSAAIVPSQGKKKTF